MNILATEPVQHELGARLGGRMAAVNTARTLVGELAAGLLLRAGIHTRLAGFSAEASANAYRDAERSYGDAGADLRAAARDVLQFVGLPAEPGTADRLRAAFSSATGAAALGTTFGTVFMQALSSSSDTTQGWVAERQILDLREQRRLRVGMPGSMAKLPRGQTAEHAALDLQGGETYQPARFAKRIALDEENLVEHDMAAILDGATLLGRAAGSLKLDAVFAVLLANAALATDSVALFHASHGNLATGAALAVGTLDSGIAALAKMTESGQPTSAQAAYVIIPPELHGLAGRLVRDLTPAGAKPLQVRSEPRLSLGVIDPATGTAYSGSATSWYIAAEASAAPSLELGLRTPQPEIRQFALGRGQWGLCFDASWDIGAKALSHFGIRRADA